MEKERRRGGPVSALDRGPAADLRIRRMVGDLELNLGVAMTGVVG